MNGGAGNDLFVYAAAADSNGANTDVVTGVDFGGADVASSADQFRFGNQVVTAVKNIDVTGAAFATLAPCSTPAPWALAKRCLFMC